MKIRQKSYGKMMLMIVLMMVLKETVIGCKIREARRRQALPFLETRTEGFLFPMTCPYRSGYSASYSGFFRCRCFYHIQFLLLPREVVSHTLSLSHQTIFTWVLQNCLQLVGMEGHHLQKLTCFSELQAGEDAQGRLRTMSLLPHSVTDDGQEGLGFMHIAIIIIITITTPGLQIAEA